MNALGPVVRQTPPVARPPVALVPAGPQDAVTLAEIDRKAFPHPWTARDFADALRQTSTAATFAMAGAQPLGAILVQYDRFGKGDISINSLAVVPEARGHKIGETLMVAALREAREKGCERAVLEVDVSNAPALRLYEKLGFEVRETLPNYYVDEGHDAYRMELPALQSPQVGDRLGVE
ncbi:MAG: ribosomal-protein-alanine N-acetyltransferase [Armatimonadetes bacterium]|nr:ribosomal-protein-alanine N-acetyltransferase [Armatimonadota bacterium]